MAIKVRITDAEMAAGMLYGLMAGVLAFIGIFCVLYVMTRW